MDSWGRGAGGVVAVTLVMIIMRTTATPLVAARAVDCTAEVEKMQPCLAFVQNQISIPNSDCCKALLNVHLNSPVCLCKLLDSSATASANGLNVTRALLLPAICDVHTDASRCPGLLAGGPEPSPSEGAETSVPRSGGGSGASYGRILWWLFSFMFLQVSGF